VETWLLGFFLLTQSSLLRFQKFSSTILLEKGSSGLERQIEASDAKCGVLEAKIPRGEVPKTFRKQNKHYNGTNRKE
jgi:hypothetical protein